MMDDAEVFAKFTKSVTRNLHIIFTMNPANPDFYTRGATSPALFNRCIIDWFGDWPREAYQQIAFEFSESIELHENCFSNSSSAKTPEERHFTMAEAIVCYHEHIESANEELKLATKKYNFVAPRDFLDFINHFVALVAEKR